MGLEGRLATKELSLPLGSKLGVEQLFSLGILLLLVISTTPDQILANSTGKDNNYKNSCPGSVGTATISVGITAPAQAQFILHASHDRGL